MKMFTVDLSDGSVVQVEAPEDATDAEIIRLARIKNRATDIERRRDELIGQAPEGPEDDGTMLGRLARGTQAGFVGTFETAALGAGTLLGENAEAAARDKITGIASVLKPSDAGADALSYKVGQAFGSIGGFAAGIAGVAAAAPTIGVGAGIAGTTAALGLGLGTARGEASERARAAGATPEERQRAVNDPRIALAGAAEALPISRIVPVAKLPFVGKLINDLGPQEVTGIGQKIQRAAITGGAEGAQEAASEVVQNLVERGYNPDRAVFDSGTAEAGALGGTAGAALQFLVDSFANTRRAGPTPTGEPPAEQQVRALLAEELPNTDGAFTAELANQVKAVEGVDGIAPERVFEIIEEEAAKIPERQGPPEPRPSGEMSNISRTAVQAMKRQADRGPEFVSSRERVTDLSDLGIASLTANQELIDTRKEVREELERTGDVTFDREKLAARNIPINKFEQIVKEERAKIPERQGPDQRVAESYKGQREDQDALMAAVGREKAGPADFEPNDRIYDPKRLLPDLRKAPEQLEFDLQGGQSGPNKFRGFSSSSASDNTGRRESDARNQQGMGTGQAKDTGAEKSKTPETDGLGDVGGDAVDTTTAKGTQPSALDKATAVRVQQWWNDTQEGGGLRILSDLSESREEKLAQQYADRARAAYDQKYGIRPNEIGLPHRRTPSARWGGQDFVEAKKEAEALGDSEMLQAINEIERTNIELGATRDINSRAREDSARELKELFPEYAAAIDADLRGFVEGALNQKIDRIEPKFTPESKQDRPVRQVVPGTRYKVDPKTLKRTGKVTFVDDPSLAPKRDTQPKSAEKNFGQELRKRWNKLNKFSTTAKQREARGGAIDAENRLSNKLNKAIFNKLEETNKHEEIRRYLERYPNVEAAIEDAYTDSLFPPNTGEAGVAPSAAKKVIKFVEDNKAASDAKILNELQRSAATTKRNIDSKRTIEDTLFGEKNANEYARNLTGRIGSLEEAMSKGDIDGAINVLTQAKDPFIRNMATKFRTLLQGYGVTLKTKKNLTNEDGEAVQGLYDAKTKTIFVDSVKGMDAHTLLHEAAHALTIKIATEPMSKLKGSEKAAKKKLQETYDDAVRLLQDPDSDIPTHYGLLNMAEFASEILSNQKFRNLMVQRLEGKEETLYDKFKNAIRALIGKPKEVTGDDKLNGLIEAILRPDPDYVGHGQYALGDIKSVREAARRLGDTQRKLVKDFDKQEFVNQAKDFFGDAKTLPRRIGLKLLASQGLADVAQVSGFNRLGFDLDSAILSQRGAITTATEATKKVVEEVQGIFKRMGDAKVAKLNELIYSQDFGATIYQVDPFLSRAEATKAYKDQQSEDPNKTKLDIWNEQQALVRAIGPDGKLAYKKMRDHYKEQYERARKIVLKEIDELGKEAGDPELVKKVKKDIYAKLFDAGTLEVYFPLVREGNYKLSYAVKNAPNTRAEYVVEMFNTRAERDQAFEDVSSDPRYENVEKSQGDMTIKDYQKAPPTSFVFEVVNSLSKAKVDNKAIEEVMRLFVATLPETSFAKSLQKRKGTPGYKEDSMYALRTKGYDLAVQTQKLNSASEIRLVEKQIEETKRPTDVPDRTFDDMKAELLSRARFAREGAKNKSIEDVGRRVNQFAFVYTIGFNASSALVNLSQIPLFVMPYLGAKYGYAATTKAVKGAGSITINAKNSLRDFYDIDLDGNISLKADPKMSDAMRQKLLDLMPLVKVASERGQLVSQSYIAESMGLDEAARATSKSAGGIMDYISGVSAYMFNHAEKFNRQNTMIAAYNLHIDKLTQGKGNPTAEQQMEAANEAIYMTQEANGGAYLETGPSLARENIGRVAMMYKSYGLQMYYSMLKQAKRAVDKDLSGAERTEAFKILLGIHGSALFFAGLQGLPLYGALRLLANMFFLDDEEEDFDTLVRKQVGEGWYKGPLVAATGLDTASRTALTGLLIQENKYNPDPSLEETIGFYLGGPALSTANRIKRGIEDLGDGQIERGIENLMPTAMSNAMKSLGRYTREGGAFTRRGDPIYEDMTTGELMGVLFGIQPAGYTQASDKNRVLKGIDKAVTAKRSALSKKYYIALRQNDREAASRIMKEMIQFGRRHPEAALNAKSLRRSLNQHMQTSADMYNGVALSPTYRNSLLELARGWDDLTD